MKWRSQCRSAGILYFYCSRPRMSLSQYRLLRPNFSFLHALSLFALVSIFGCSKPVELGLEAQDETIHVEILSVKIDELEYQAHDRRFRMEPKPGKAPQEYLQITVDVTNRTDSKKLYYAGWCEEGYANRRARLEDEHSNVYEPKLHAVSGRLVVASIVGHHLGTLYPGSSMNDVLLFEVPVDTAEVLTLELPKGAYSDKEKGSLKFRIPSSMIQIKEGPTRSAPATVRPATAEPATTAPISLKPASMRPTPMPPAVTQQAPLKPTPTKPTPLKPATTKPTVLKPATSKPAVTQN
jgi:hypothetical protein